MNIETILENDRNKCIRIKLRENKKKKTFKHVLGIKLHLQGQACVHILMGMLAYVGNLRTYVL